MLFPILISLVLIATALFYAGRAYWAWVLPCALGLCAWAWRGIHSPVAFASVAIPFGVLAIVFGLPFLRRVLVTKFLMRALASIFPKMSDTERIALEAGTVWWDAELFSGAPRWKKLLEFKPKPLSDREQRFLAGPVEELCRMVNDWEVHEKGDLSREAWDFIKRERFMGMIIPEKFGGLGFSAIAHSAVVAKLASHSVTAAVTVMVPNSLGPAELLLHYGTDEQKQTYLPRLAVGLEVPCFALTEPGAGSDAGGMTSRGVVCRETYNGKEVLGMRLTWDKRYITLSPVATLLGLAFRLHDPERLLGDKEDLGITCALIPTDTGGVEVGRRHDPLHIPFLNGPTHGRDVFVPLDFIIGGPKMAGQGWRMLMECLSAGRSISLPANSVGGAELATRVVGAYATVREQFNMAIGRFEGIEAPLARIAGTTYWMNALRVLTAGAVDAGEKPAVISAIAKLTTTEGMRRVINDAMDVQGGLGICMGPRNSLAHAYTAVPIGITVEGANILTRTMIIFGQGAIRCHPFALAEMEAARTRDVAKFDAAFFGHVQFVFQNATRSFILGLTNASLASTPSSSTSKPPSTASTPLGGETARVLRQLTRLSASFSIIADVAMGTLGGGLKRKELLSGRLADALGWMYIASATVKRFVDEGEPERDQPMMRWACTEAEFQIQTALRGLIDNLPNRFAAMLLRPIVFPLGARLQPPSDRLTTKAARAILDGGEARLALTRDIYVPREATPGLGYLERALALTVACEPARKKLRDAVKARTLPRGGELELVDLAYEKGVITDAERKAIRDASRARDEAIQVDDFAHETPGGTRSDERARAPRAMVENR